MLSTLGAAGCGDAILCDSSPLVVIQTPTSAIAIDGDSVAPGVQTDVRVRSSLLPTDGLELIVLDGAGQQVATQRGLAGEGGTTLFQGVTVPAPRATLRAIGRGTCGLAEDTVEVDVIAGSGCDLQIAPAPLAVGAYPVGVLNAALDPDPTVPGFQATAAVATRGGWIVELFASTGGAEGSLGFGVADAMGLVQFPHTVDDGPVTFRAVCRGPAGEVLPSVTASALVDTTPPSCAFTSPAPATSITPAHDQDGDLGNGVQLALEAHVVGGDAGGEPVELRITGEAGTEVVPMSPVDAGGKTAAEITLDPATTPATFLLALAARDRAGNPCASAHSYEVVYDGCSIEVVAPTGPVTADADNAPGNGSQVDIALAVAPLCAGQTVTSTCGSNSPSGVVPPDGQLTLRATLCGASPCEAEAVCTFRVASPAGVQTQASASLAFDDQGPAVTVAVVEPALACGAQITPASDVDPATLGVQVVARVSAAGAVSHALELTNTGGTTSAPAPAPGDVTITVAPGLNLLTGVAFDPLGNRGQSAQCTVSLADIAIGFAGPAADGLVGRRDGSVAGGALTFDLCGTVDRTGAAVTVRVGDGPPVAATVNGTSWCRTVSLAEAPAHAVTVTATQGPSFGTATLALGVDLTPPDAVTAFVPAVPTRQRVAIEWNAPGDNGAPVAAYVVKGAKTPLTDANFDTVGQVIPTGTPRTPGLKEVAELFPARTGTPYWLGVASVDAAGNRAAAAIVGPIVPLFDQIGPIASPEPAGDAAMGAAIAHGRFNDDDFEDVAVAAPTQSTGGQPLSGAVYVYFGGPSGLPTTPQAAILGTSAGARTGAGLAAVRWTSAARDDLVIGAPGANGGAGRLFVFAGGAAFPTGAVAAGSAPLQIGVHPTAPGWFAAGGLGAAAAAADVDGDGVRDLVASAPGGGGTGGIVIFYGGTITASLMLSDTDTSGFGAAIVEYLPDPQGLAGRGFGTYLHAVDPTRGPLDVDDDLVVGYADDLLSTSDSVYVIRGNGTRPAASLTERAFVAGRDVRIDLVTVYRHTELGAQATSIADHDGDGASDLVISAYRNLNGAGTVLVIDGDTVGTGGVARTTDPGVVLTTIQGASGMRLGAVLVAHDDMSDDDVDGDGLDDLIVGGVTGSTARLFVWFGGTLPLGPTTIATAGAQITGPAVFGFSPARPQGPAGQARWVGDLNGDGLDDVCWSSPYDNATSLDGAFAVLLDGVPPGP